MNKNNVNTSRPLSVVEKIRAYRDEFYERYMKTHKELDVHSFYEEMLKGKKCKHATKTSKL